MVKNIKTFFLDFYNKLYYKLKMFLKLLMPLFIFSCTVPYNFSFVTDAVQGNVDCEKKLSDTEPGGCYCPSYEKDGSSKCKQSEILKLWLKSGTNAKYDYKKTDDESIEGMYCENAGTIARGGVDEFGFCSSVSTTVSVTDNNWSYNGYQIPALTGYTVHNTEAFYEVATLGTFTCITYIATSQNEAIVNCRRGGTSTFFNFYSKITSATGYNIKDVYFRLDDDLIPHQAVLVADNSNNLYLNYHNFSGSSVGTGVYTTPEINDNNIGDAVITNVNADTYDDLRILTAIDATALPISAADFKVLAVDKTTGSFMSNVSTNCPDNTDGVGSVDYFKFEYDSENPKNCFYTYKPTSGYVTFCYNGCTDPNNKYVGTDFIHASGIFINVDGTFFLDAPSSENNNKIFKINVANFLSYNEQPLIDIQEDVESAFADFHVFQDADQTIKLTVAEQSDDQKVHIYFDTEPEVAKFAAQMSKNKIKITVIDGTHFILTYINNGQTYIYKFTKNPV